MIRPLFAANEVLAFLLELAAMVVLGFWGWTVGGALLAIAIPLLAILLWGLFAAPRARFTVPLAAQLAVKVAVFGAAVVGLAATGHPVLAGILAVVLLVNTVAATIWRTRGLRLGD